MRGIVRCDRKRTADCATLCAPSEIAWVRRGDGAPSLVPQKRSTAVSCRRKSSVPIRVACDAPTAVGGCSAQSRQVGENLQSLMPTRSAPLPPKLGVRAGRTIRPSGAGNRRSPV
jgi:hypothetical protein